MKQALFLLLGYPGAGKSTFAKQFATATGIVRVNGDEIRRYMYRKLEQIRNPANNPAVFGALDYVTEILLNQGQSVLVDASHNKKITRTRKEALGRKANVPVILIWVQTPLELAMEREVERAKQDPSLKIPQEVYLRMAEGIEEPTSEEKVIYIDGTKPFTEQLAAFDTQLEKVI